MKIKISKGIETPVTKFFCSSPETDAFFLKKGAWSDDILAFCRKLERERDEARKKCASWVREWRELRVFCRQLDGEANDMLQERDEARAQVKELIYISDRAIALAELDFENDKFGVVSELRNDLEKIKEETK